MDLRSLGYFRVMYRDLLQRVESKCQMFHYYKEIPEATPILLRACPALLRHQQKPYSDPYPWLDKEDQRRHMSDRQILYDRIDLRDSLLTSKEKGKLMALILKYKKAFSLRDEIGHCPNIKADIKVIDDSSFFVCPFPLSETDKPFMDKQME